MNAPEPEYSVAEPSSPSVTAPAIHGQELRERAASGAVLVAIRGIGVRVLGLVGYLVFARVLTPAEFGVAALGLSITFFAQFLADAGLGAALIRRAAPPTRHELASLVGAQLAITSGFLAAAAALVIVLDSRTAAVTALFLASLPPLALRVPAAIHLERDLRYRPLVATEILEVAVFNGSAILAVLLGAGVYGLAAASVLKTVTSAVVLNRLAPGLLPMPRLDIAPLRGLLRFGITFQAASAVTLVRESLWSIGIGAIGGYAVLGLWAVASRLISIPLLVFESLWRVSFPAMARLLQAGEDAREPVERGLAIGGIMTVALLAPLAAGGGYALTGALGARWDEAGQIFPPVCLALSFGLPISVVTIGYLYAVGDARAVLVTNLALTGAMLAVGFVLLPVVGYRGLGVAWFVGTTVDATMLTRFLHRYLKVAVTRHLLRPIAAGIAAYALGVAAAEFATAALVQAALATIVSLAAYAGAVSLADRPGLYAATKLVLRSLRAAKHEVARPARA